MRYSRITLALALMGTIAATAQGQGIGGLIKRKVGDAVKPKEEQAAKPAPKESSPFEFELTAETMAGFERGLKLEIKLYEAYRDSVAKLTVRAQQYEKCKREISQSPEFLKIAEEFSSRLDKAKTPAETQKAMEWKNDEFQVLTKKLCGEDPEPLFPQQQKEFTRAQEAGALEFAKSWKKPPSRHDQPGNREQDDAFRECDAGAGSFEGEGSSMPLHLGILCEPTDSSATGVPVQDASTDPLVRHYLKIKEHIEKYCTLSKELRAEAVKNGIRVPGDGQDIYWIFHREFAISVDERCDTLMPLFAVINAANWVREFVQKK